MSEAGGVYRGRLLQTPENGWAASDISAMNSAEPMLGMVYGNDKKSAQIIPCGVLRAFGICSLDNETGIMHVFASFGRN